MSCKKVKSGGGDILPTELDHITKGQRSSLRGERLACQVAMKTDMEIELKRLCEDIFGVKSGNVLLSRITTKLLSSKNLR
ncbi:hypothetical protein OK016_13430 [Vibrio chagasii]|nr:hypothetical protein [Vibrio chagasii]